LIFDVERLRTKPPLPVRRTCFSLDRKDLLATGCFLSNTG
jgi:hypothetical protein